MKIAIVEDELDLAELIAFNLEKEGFSVFIATDGKTALKQITAELPDMVVLDLMLPELSGFEVCKALRNQKSTANIPIIMLTAKGEEIDRVVGFEIGADDYMVKPFSSRELILRIKAIFRRNCRESNDDKIISSGNITLDKSRHLVTVNNIEVILTITEFKLLVSLLERAGRIQSREILLRDVWGYNHMADSRTVDTHITRLRSKLGESGDFIKTIRGVGYKFEDNN